MFKPLYYLGCKSAISDSIQDAVDSADPDRGRACDLFAGTGAIAAALSTSRCVTSVDIQEYSRVVCNAQLNPADLQTGELLAIPGEVGESDMLQALEYCFEALMDLEHEAAQAATAGSPDELVGLIEAPPLLFREAERDLGKLAKARRCARARLIERGLSNSSDSTVSRYFGGLYFSFRQAIYLDAALRSANQRCGRDRDTLLSAVLSTASTMVNTVGKQFAQPVRPRDKSGIVKRSVMSSVLKDRAIDAMTLHGEWMQDYARIENKGRAHEAVRGDYLAVLSQKGADFSVLYADPPYTRDHYSRFYHVLETMCLRDEPAVTTVARKGGREPSRGAYRVSRHQSPFCVRSLAPEAFAGLFKQARALSLPLVLSYSPSEQGDGTHPRVVSASGIISIARESYRSVEVQYLDGKVHNKHNRGGLELAKRSHAEMLLVCRP